MDNRDSWIALNAVNCLVLAIGVILSCRRVARTRLALRLAHPLESVRLMQGRNYAVAREGLAVNALLLLLGAYLIGVALRWSGEVPSFVDTGTGGFALIWALWAFREWYDARRMRQIAEVIAREHRDSGTPGGDGTVLALEGIPGARSDVPGSSQRRPVVPATSIAGSLIFAAAAVPSTGIVGFLIFALAVAMVICLILMIPFRDRIVTLGVVAAVCAVIIVLLFVIAQGDTRGGLALAYLE